VDAEALGAQLRHAGVADVRTDTTTRAAFSTDASLYRVVPLAVARPRDADDVCAALSVCRAEGVPLTVRGAGTSIAGNAVGTGLVLDFGRHMNRVLSVDPDAATATVEPGVVQEVLQRHASPHGLRFGPDPSSSSRCTLGGMIGNNACGTRALGYGRTSDNIVDLQLLTAAGEPLDLSGGSAVTAELRRIAQAGLATIRTELGRFGRQVSGYALENLLPEHGFDVTRLLVGSEGTLAVVTAARVRLVPALPERVGALLAVGSVADAVEVVGRELPEAPPDQTASTKKVRWYKWIWFETD